MLPQDLRYAIRALVRRPTFMGFAIATLAIGIGASTSLFSLADAALLRPPPFPAADRLDELYLTSRAHGRGLTRMRWSYRRYDMLRRFASSYSAIAAYGPYEFNLSGTDAPQRVGAEAVSATYFRTLGVDAHLGRTFVPAEDSAGGPAAVTVIGFDLWTSRFGADRAVIGRSVRLNGVDITVIGVMPRGFQGLTGSTELWVPSAMVPRMSYADYHTTNQDFISVVGRRAPGVTLEQARAQLAVLGVRIERVLPSDTDVPTVFSATAVPLSEARIDPAYRRAILVLLTAVLLLLLLTCANVAGLELARNIGRSREIAVRLAIGADRARVVNLLLTETAVVALSGGVAGAIIATWAPHLIRLPSAIAGPGNQYGQLGEFAAPRLSAAVLGFALLMAGATTVLAGLLPALTASRADLSTALKQGGARAVHGRRRGRRNLRSMLVIGEVALALVLSAGAMLALGAARRLERVPLGIEPAHVLTFRIAPSNVRYPTQTAPALIERVLAAVTAVPGVEAATVDACAPLGPRCANSTLYVIGRPAPPAGLAPEVLRHYVGPDHFRTLGVPIVRGRPFTAADRAGRPRVAIINETAARRFWRGQDPIGQRVWFGGGSSFDRPDSSAEIVGVVGDVPYGSSTGASMLPSFYTPYLQFTYAERMVMLRTRGDPKQLVPALRVAVASVDPGVAVFDVRELTDRLGDAWLRPKFTGRVLTAFAVLAAVLAAAGIYGIAMQRVRERERELGIRVALGASAGRIARLVLGETMVLVAAGVGTGCAAALVLFRIMRAALADMGTPNPVALCALTLAMATVAVVASWLPARRAARSDPAITMRAE
ncbi:MAG TPA: ABC transporter permease [Gemmatimonadaceae bacterium]